MLDSLDWLKVGLWTWFAIGVALFVNGLIVNRRVQRLLMLSGKATERYQHRDAERHLRAALSSLRWMVSPRPRRTLRSVVHAMLAPPLIQQDRWAEAEHHFRTAFNEQRIESVVDAPTRLYYRCEWLRCLARTDPDRLPDAHQDFADRLDTVTNEQLQSAAANLVVSASAEAMSERFDHGDRLFEILRTGFNARGADLASAVQRLDRGMAQCMIVRERYDAAEAAIQRCFPDYDAPLGVGDDPNRHELNFYWHFVHLDVPKMIASTEAWLAASQKQSAGVGHQSTGTTSDDTEQADYGTIVPRQHLITALKLRGCHVDAAALAETNFQISRHPWAEPSSRWSCTVQSALTLATLGRFEQAFDVVRALPLDEPIGGTLGDSGKVLLALGLSILHGDLNDPVSAITWADRSLASQNVKPWTASRTALELLQLRLRAESDAGQTEAVRRTLTLANEIYGSISEPRRSAKVTILEMRSLAAFADGRWSDALTELGRLDAETVDILGPRSWTRLLMTVRAGRCRWEIGECSAAVEQWTGAARYYLEFTDLDHPRANDLVVGIRQAIRSGYGFPATVRDALPPEEDGHRRGETLDRLRKWSQNVAETIGFGR